MSELSFDYLRFNDGEELLAKRNDLTDMVAELRALGYLAHSRKTLDLANSVNRINTLISELGHDLYNSGLPHIWKQVECYNSGDIEKETLDRYLKKIAKGEII